MFVYISNVNRRQIVGHKKMRDFNKIHLAAGKKLVFLHQASCVAFSKEENTFDNENSETNYGNHFSTYREKVSVRTRKFSVIKKKKNRNELSQSYKRNDFAAK